MQPSRESLAIKCPHCGTPKLHMRMASCNASGEELWSDSLMFWPMASIAISPLQQCDYCGRFYLPDSYYDGVICPVTGANYGYPTYSKIKDALDYFEFSGFVDIGQFEGIIKKLQCQSEEEKEDAKYWHTWYNEDNLRKLLILGYNDWFYRPHILECVCPEYKWSFVKNEPRIPTEEDKAIFKRISMLYIENHLMTPYNIDRYLEQDCVLAVELYRECAMFDEALELLESLDLDSICMNKIAFMIKEKILQHDDKVFKFPKTFRLHRKCLYFSPRPETWVNTIDSDYRKDSAIKAAVEDMQFSHYNDEELPF